MKRVSVKLPEETVTELDRLADDQDTTRSDAIRGTLDDGLDTDDDEELQRLQTVIHERDDRIEWLETQVERLQNTHTQILAQRNENTELQLYVDEQREWNQAGLLTRVKWRLAGKDHQ